MSRIYIIIAEGVFFFFFELHASSFFVSILDFCFFFFKRITAQGNS
jgi:hypothetical protein